MIEQAESLVKALLQLKAAITTQNELLVQIVAQNADLIEAAAKDDEDEEVPQYDLAGRPIG